MSDSDKSKEIEEARRKREDELIFLLLLLMDDSTAKSKLAPINAVNIFHSTLLVHGIPEIAESMAEAHIDAVKIYGGDGVTPGASEIADLIYKYSPTAATTAQAMADAIKQSLWKTADPEAKEDAQHVDTSKLTTEQIETAIKTAGYSRDNPSAIALGVERVIVSASNMGGMASAKKTNLALAQKIVDDGKTTAICLDRKGLILAADNPYWRTNWCPLHWKCRSIISPTDNSNYTESLPTIPPAPGFGLMPFQL